MKKPHPILTGTQQIEYLNKQLESYPTLVEASEKTKSKDYKVRFVGEYEELCVRYIKLMIFITKIRVAEENKLEQPKHDCPCFLLEEQAHTMALYLSILERRAELEGIVLIYD